MLAPQRNPNARPADCAGCAVPCALLLRLAGPHLQALQFLGVLVGRGEQLLPLLRRRIQRLLCSILLLPRLRQLRRQALQLAAQLVPVCRHHSQLLPGIAGHGLSIRSGGRQVSLQLGNTLLSGTDRSRCLVPLCGCLLCQGLRLLQLLLQLGGLMLQLGPQVSKIPLQPGQGMC